MQHAIVNLLKSYNVLSNIQICVHRFMNHAWMSECDMNYAWMSECDMNHAWLSECDACQCLKLPSLYKLLPKNAQMTNLYTIIRP